MKFVTSRLPTANDLRSAARVLYRLPLLMRRRVIRDEAHRELRARLENRNANFLALAKRAIYQNPQSPYRRLLEFAGCEFADLEQSVQREGLEESLRLLFRKGVYLTVDEFRGHRPVIRGSLSFQIMPGQLRNPGTATDMVWRSGGSRSAAMEIPIDFASIRDHAIDQFLEIEAHGGLRWAPAIWSVPGGAAIGQVIQYTICGMPPGNWYLPVNPAAPGLHPRYVWGSRMLRLAGLFGGVILPQAVHVSPRDPQPIIRWIVETLESKRTPFLFTYVSCAVRICQAARDTGLDVKGARFMVTGEPLTPARLAIIQSAGAQPITRYGTTEAGALGRGCMAPEAADDVHVVQDGFGVIQPDDQAHPALPPDTLLVTSLLPRARLILLNASMGDRAVMTKRNCGCPLGRLGWTTHLHTIRSFEKLTVGGVTALHADLIRVLEEVLPGRFGGGAMDYQLAEGETENGKPDVRLLVHPRLGSLDENRVWELFLDAVGFDSGADRLTALLWREAGLPIVERREPKITGAGKVQHVHSERPENTAEP